MGREHGDVAGQRTEPDLQGLERFKSEVDRQVGAEQIGARDRPHHQRASREEGERVVSLADQVGEVRRSMARRVQGPDRISAQGDLLPRRQRIPACAHLSLELAGAGDEVVVEVGV